MVFGLFFAFVIKLFFVQAYMIPSSSMRDTLLVGDCLIASKISYELRIPILEKRLFTIKEPKRQEIIIFYYPKNKKINYIKRIIGFPGERIQVIDGNVFINKEVLSEHYLLVKKNKFSSGFLDFGPITVPNDCLFVMGDNRNNSSDSRDWGFVPYKNIKAKAILVYWSWDRKTKSVRFSRLLNLLL